MLPLSSSLLRKELEDSAVIKPLLEWTTPIALACAASACHRCNRIVVQTRGKLAYSSFPECSRQCLLDKPDRSHSRHCPHRCMAGQTPCNCL